MHKKLNKAVLAIVVATAAAASAPALAESGGGDVYSTITSAVDFGGVVTGIGAVAALLAVVYVARKGIRMFMGMLK